MARPVLVVHDDEGLRRVVRRRLEREGLTVTEATSAGQALQTVTTQPAGWIIVICGSRMAGITEKFCAAARQADPDACVYYFATQMPVFDGLFPPGVEVFPKPQGLNDLCQAVRAATE